MSRAAGPTEPAKTADGTSEHPDKQTRDVQVLADFATLSEFGATPRGGVDREAMTEPDVAQRDWLAAWLTERGFSIEIDRIGNMFGLLELVPGAPYVLLGSHLDSQPLGGKFDGAYGVLAAAQAVWRIKQQLDAGQPLGAAGGADAAGNADATRTGEPDAGRATGAPKYNLGIVNWFNEEGSRFEPSMMGSGVYTGVLDADTALKTTDLAGTSVAEALEAGGYLGSGDGPAAAAYAEIHIEQGRLLEDAGNTIGLVEATWAAKKYHLIVHGDQSHTGSTVIADRHDALLGASHLVVTAREIADELGIHTSVGQLVVLPNSPVVVPREARLHLDMRSPDMALLEEGDARLQARIKEIESLAAVRIEEDTAHSWDRKPYSDAGVMLAAHVADDLGLSKQRIMTVAGHDSTNMKDMVPTVMLFVPSVEGISHNEGEYTSDADVCAGVDLLTGVAERLLTGALD